MCYNLIFLSHKIAVENIVLFFKQIIDLYMPLKGEPYLTNGPNQNSFLISNFLTLCRGVICSCDPNMIPNSRI